MAHRDRNPIEDAVGEYWDTLISGMPHAPAPDLDPTFIAAIHRLRALDDARAPDPAFVKRLERKIMNTSDTHAWFGSEIPIPRLTGFPNGYGGATPASQHLPRLDLPRRRWAAPLATAALVLFVLIGDYLVFGGPLRFSGQGEEPASIPALVATPEASSAPAATSDETLLSWTVPAAALPAGDAEVVFYRLTIEPGASLSVLAGPYCGCGGETLRPGIGAEVVEEGAYSLALDAPFTVVRPTGEEEVAAGTEATLSSGDVVRIADYAASGEIRNDGDGPVALIGVAYLAQEGMDIPAPALPEGVTVTELSRAYAFDVRKLPAGPLTITLRRQAVPAEATLGPYDQIVLEAMTVVTGKVDLVYFSAGATEGQAPRIFTAGRTDPFLAVKPGAHRLLTNTGGEPASILVLLIAPAT